MSTLPFSEERVSRCPVCLVPQKQFRLDDGCRFCASEAEFPGAIDECRATQVGLSELVRYWSDPSLPLLVPVAFPGERLQRNYWVDGRVC